MRTARRRLGVALPLFALLLIASLALAPNIAQAQTPTPPAPTGLSATAGDTTITVSWTAGTPVSGQLAVDGHNVCAILATTPDFPAGTTAGCVQTANASTAADTSATLTGLSNGTDYKVAVRSFNNDSVAFSAWTEVTGTFTPSSCPTALASQETVCNLDATVNNVLFVGYDPSPDALRAFAFPFTTGDAGSGYDLRSVHISTGDPSGTPGDLVVEIHAQVSGGGVGNLAGTLSGASPTAGGVHEFTASGITLARNANYFLVVSAPNAMSGGDNYYALAAAPSGAPTGSSGWSIQYQRYTKTGNDDFVESSGSTTIVPFAIVADVNPALRLKLRVFLESALP